MEAHCTRMTLCSNRLEGTYWSTAVSLTPFSMSKRTKNSVCVLFRLQQVWCRKEPGSSVNIITGNIGKGCPHRFHWSCASEEAMGQAKSRCNTTSAGAHLDNSSGNSGELIDRYWSTATHRHPEVASDACPHHHRHAAIISQTTAGTTITVPRTRTCDTSAKMQSNWERVAAA